MNFNKEKPKLTFFEEVIVDNTYRVWTTLLFSVGVNLFIYVVFYLLFIFINKAIMPIPKYENSLNSYLYESISLGLLIYSFYLKKDNYFNINKLIKSYLYSSIVFAFLSLSVFISFSGNEIYFKTVCFNFLMLTGVVFMSMIINYSNNKYIHYIVPIAFIIVGLFLFNDYSVNVYNFIVFFYIFLISLILYKKDEAINTTPIVKKLKIINEKVDGELLNSSKVIATFAVIMSLLNTYLFVYIFCIYGPKYLIYICSSLKQTEGREKYRAIFDLAINVSLILFVYLVVKAGWFNSIYNFYF